MIGDPTQRHKTTAMTKRRALTEPQCSICVLGLVVGQVSTHDATFERRGICRYVENLFDRDPWLLRRQFARAREKWRGPDHSKSAATATTDCGEGTGRSRRDTAAGSAARGAGVRRSDRRRHASRYRRDQYSRRAVAG